MLLNAETLNTKCRKRHCLHFVENLTAQCFGRGGLVPQERAGTKAGVCVRPRSPATLGLFTAAVLGREGQAQRALQSSEKHQQGPVGSGTPTGTAARPRGG